jgi:hypothetical protein
MVFLEVIIAISFIFFITSTIVSGINEIIVMLMNKRGNELREAIKLLMDESGTEWSDKFYDHPIIGSLREPARWVSLRAIKQRIIKFFNRDKSKVIFNPSYIPASHFTEVVTDFLAGRYTGSPDEAFNKKISHDELKYISDMRAYLEDVDAYNYTRFKTLFVDSDGQSFPVKRKLTIAFKTSPDDLSLGVFVQLVHNTITTYIEKAPVISSAKAQMKFIKKNMKGPGSSNTTKVLYGLIQNSESLGELKQKVGIWYDDYMDRVSGWYKRKVKFALLWISAVLVFSMNIDAIVISKELFSNVSLREAMVAAAEDYSENNPVLIESQDTTTAQLQEKVDSLRNQIASFRNFDLPIGWGGKPDIDTCACSYMKSIWKKLTPLKLLGLLLSILAISMGAPFWFDVLNKFIRVRQTVPATTPKNGVNSNTA